MSILVENITKLVTMLPENDQQLAYELVKKLVLAWDPDFTKVTPEEAVQIQAAEKSGFISEEDIDWENLGKYS